MKKFGYFAIVVLCLISLFALQKREIQNKAGIFKLFPKKDYQHDLRQLSNALRNRHPQSTAFISADSLDTLVQRNLDQLTASTKLGEFLWSCRALVASIGCGHTRAYRQTSSPLNLPEHLLFPMEVNYIGEKLYIIDPLSNADQLKAGTEILSINSVPASALLKKIYKHISADGHNQSSKQYFVNKHFKKYCPYQLVFPDTFVAEVLDSKTKAVKQVQLKNYVPAKQITQVRACKEALCLEFKDQQEAAILTIKSFNYYGNDFSTFQSFIDDSFEQIEKRKTKNLLIDLRDNGGGDPYCAVYLLRYIAKKPFRYFHPNTAGYEDLKAPIPPMKQAFPNQVYCLINGGCFSTSGHFASILKQEQMGIFIGQETGATYTCNDNSIIVSLNKTNIKLRIATQTFRTAAQGLPKNRGILPDHLVVPKLSDLLHRNDYILDFSLSLLEVSEKE